MSQLQVVESLPAKDTGRALKVIFRPDLGIVSAPAILARDSALPRWMGYFGAGTAIAGPAGMFRNTTDVIAPMAAVNNYLLPVGRWFLAEGSCGSVGRAPKQGAQSVSPAYPNAGVPSWREMP